MPRLGFFACAIVLAGCGARAVTPLDRPAEPIAQQLARTAPEMKGQHFRTLLDFENASDTAFVISHPGPQPTIEPGVAHTGRHGLATTREVEFRVSSLLYGQKLPGPWTLLGVYLRSAAAGVIEIECLVNDEVLSTNRQTFAPGAWTLATVDLAATRESADRLSTLAASDVVTLRCRPVSLAAAVVMDDVLLLDNTARLVSTGDAGLGGWTVARRGNGLLIDAPGRFNMRLDAAGERAWGIEEANDLRARFSSAGSHGRDLTIFVDGRSFWDGQYRCLASKDSPAAEVADELKSAATVTVAEATGRLERNTPGDEDNDGFNERRGAYQLAAAGPRLDCTITPAAATVTWPVLEVSGLPAGRVTATVDGRLIERTTRLPDGRLLVKIPVRLAAAASVQLSVR